MPSYPECKLGCAMHRAQVKVGTIDVRRQIIRPSLGSCQRDVDRGDETFAPKFFEVHLGSPDK